MSSDTREFAAHFLEHCVQGRSVNRQTTAGPGTATFGEHGCIPILDVHLGRAYSQLIGHDLSEGRARALTMRRHASVGGDMPRRGDRHLRAIGAVGSLGAGSFDDGRQAHAEERIFSPLGCLARPRQWA